MMGEKPEQPAQKIVPYLAYKGAPAAIGNIDDVHAHFTTARDAGTVIASEPEDQFYGDRRYRALDLEGHHWVFSTRVREIAPDQWEIPGSES
ncbi:MAG: hypothetical protein VYE73_09180 [Acidobacteriota bacterium]|nr:hypothetical protein [Acidobacteriota bacterium]